jgi:hypothetical protein
MPLQWFALAKRHQTGAVFHKSGKRVIPNIGKRVIPNIGKRVIPNIGKRVASMPKQKALPRWQGQILRWRSGCHTLKTA